MGYPSQIQSLAGDYNESSKTSSWPSGTKLELFYRKGLGLLRDPMCVGLDPLPRTVGVTITLIHHFHPSGRQLVPPRVVLLGVLDRNITRFRRIDFPNDTRLAVTHEPSPLEQRCGRAQRKPPLIVRGGWFDNFKNRRQYQLNPLAREIEL
jgi:hypothetical protein